MSDLREKIANLINQHGGFTQPEDFIIADSILALPEIRDAQAEVERLKRRLEQLSKAIESFLSDADYTAPWDREKWFVIVKRLHEEWLKVKRMEEE